MNSRLRIEAKNEFKNFFFKLITQCLEKIWKTKENTETLNL